MATVTPVVATDDRGVAVPFAAPVERIVSLLPSLTETVCELGACARLIGVDRHSDWPDAVARLPRLGGGLDDVQLERIVALRPDVVLASTSARALGRLEALGLKVLAFDSNRLADTRRSIGVLAAVLGRRPAGEALLAAIDAGVAQAAARVPPAWRGATVYVEVASTPHAASEASFIGELLLRLGLRNIVPGAFGPFPQLNPEYVIRARPDLVIAARRPLAVMAQRPGWASLPALRAGQVCGFEPRHHDMLVRPGPRVGEAAGLIVNCLAGLPTPAARP